MILDMLTAKERDRQPAPPGTVVDPPAGRRYHLDMTIEQLRLLHQARPFTPFRIHLADGRHFDVEHPELLAQSPGGRVIALATSEHAIERIDLLLVVSLEELGNGRGPRRRR